MLAIAMLTLDNTGTVRSDTTLSSDTILQQACENTRLFEGVAKISQERERFNIIIHGVLVLARHMYITGSEYQWFVMPRVVSQLQDFVVTFEGFPRNAHTYRTWLAALARAFPSSRQSHLQLQNKYLLDENTRFTKIIVTAKKQAANLKAEIEELQKQMEREFPLKLTSEALLTDSGDPVQGIMTFLSVTSMHCDKLVSYK